MDCIVNFILYRSLMRNNCLTGVVLALLSATTVLGGSYTNDFSNPNSPGITLNGITAIQNGELVMTPATGGNGSAVLDDLDSGASIETFTATFSVRFAPGNTEYEADGLFFGFGPGLSANSNFGVEGPGPSAAVGVEFDTYDNGAPDNVGIDVKVAGVEIATTVMNVSDFVDSQFHEVSIQLKRNGTLTVAWGPRVIYNNLFLPNWSPVNGQFAFGTSTGYFNEECDILDLVISTTVAAAAIAPTITLQPPPSASLLELSPLTLRAGFDGTAPLSFQWNLNGTAIPDATDSILQIPNVPLTNNGATITCAIANSAGSVTSTVTTLTVTPDAAPLTIQSVVGSDTFGTMTVTFSKPVLQTTATKAANYSITGLTISAAAPWTGALGAYSLATTSDERVVVLTTTPQTPGAAYTLVVNNLQDQTSAGHAIAANSQMTFHAFSYVSGYMSYDIYDNQAFSAGGLQQFESTFNTAVVTRTLLFRSADTPDWEYGGSYGSISQGLIVAPETGAYIFHVASDDQGQLFLSTDDTPAHLGQEPICQVTTFSGHLDWAGHGQGAPDTNPQEGNVSNPINLVQGQKYFFRFCHVEGTGADGISMGWELPSSHGAIGVIPGTNLMALVNTDVSPVPTLSISRTPAGITVTFSGVLQSADVPTGPWADVPSASPLVVNPNGRMQFYRARAGQ